MLSLSLVAASTLFAGARAQITPNNLVPASTSGSLSALKYTHVGGTGSYMQVTDIIPGEWPSCTVNPSCIQQEKQISGKSPLVITESWQAAAPLAMRPRLEGEPAALEGFVWLWGG